MGKPNLDSTKIKLAVYLLNELEKPQKEDFLGFSKQELAEEFGISEGKVNTFINQIARDMFKSRKGLIIPLYDNFDGKDEFLKELSERVKFAMTPNYIEGRTRTSEGAAPGWRS